NLRVQLLQPPGSSNKSPAGAKHGYEMRDTTLCLLPNFIGSVQIMSTPIGIIRILVSVEIFLWLCGVKFARLANGAVRPVRRVGIDNVGQRARDSFPTQQRRAPNALERALPERTRIRHSFPFSARFVHRIGYLGRFAGSGLHSDLGADYD